MRRLRDPKIQQDGLAVHSMKLRAESDILPRTHKAKPDARIKGVMLDHERFAIKACGNLV
jgi:hypothetical protein